MCVLSTIGDLKCSLDCLVPFNEGLYYIKFSNCDFTLQKWKADQEPSLANAIENIHYKLELNHNKDEGELIHLKNDFLKLSKMKIIINYQ